MQLNIAHFYPDLLNLYGDKGNIISLQKRCQWRNIDVNVTSYNINDKVDFSNIDIVFIGGGSDREQLIVCQRLLELKDEIKNYVETNGVLLAICGGYQLIGNYYQLNNDKIEGLGLVDIYTIQKPGRLIGNVVLETRFGSIVGFENHGGRTYFNDKNLSPFGAVLCGNGNNGEDQLEGIIYKNLIGTYLHGPLLPKNPKLTDEVIKRALERKYGETIELSLLDDYEEDIAHKYILSKYR